jgi:hypothetical protein
MDTARAAMEPPPIETLCPDADMVDRSRGLCLAVEPGLPEVIDPLEDT